MLTGCFDTLEELTISPDGTGTYQSTMDMGGMFDMIEMMAAMDTSSNGQLKKLADKDVDSVLNLRSIVDTSSELNDEQKRLFRDAKMSIAIKQKEKIFKMGMTYPFKNLEDVKKIIELNESGKGVGLFGKEGNANPLLGRAGNGNDSEAMPGLSKVFDMTIQNGLIERKLNEEKLKKLMENDKMAEMGQAKQMLEGVTFRSIFHLPKAAKKITGTNATLSADKKTVTVKASMVDLFDNPQALSFRIEY